MGYIKDYDSNFISAVYDHDKEKDRRLQRRKNTKHVYNSRYKTAKEAENTRHYEGYWIKDTYTKYTYSISVSEHIEPIYDIVWGKYPIGGYKIYKLLNEEKTIDLGTEWNYKRVLVGYKKVISRNKKMIDWERVPLKNPVLKKSRVCNYSFKKEEQRKLLNKEFNDYKRTMVW